MMPSQRQILRSLREFARREVLEKKSRVSIRRLRSTTVLRRGRTPDFRVRAKGEIEFLIESRRGDEVRVYFFDKFGRPLGADNFRPNDRILKELLSHTRRLPL